MYENERSVVWADGESCPYGFEQTPEGFIRHTVELLFLMKPAVAANGSVWWNIMDTYNTRTPIRGNARERLHAMSEVPGSRKGWTEHGACRHSAGHMYL
ncbi:MAG: site-specific DNA-methyltransferase, partial [Actinomycetota bacterium]|nr:site-specific DNA-methyltransferase [Actinomycetota bacterium]